MPAKVEPRKFSVGEEVMAKWPKTTLYYKGKILDFNDIEYLIKFDDSDDSELPIKFKYVKSTQLSRSRSRSRGRTPTSKSPGRKSPGRKSPARKSPPPRKSIRTSKALLLDSNSSSTSSKNEAKQTESTSPVINSAVLQPTRQSARIAQFEASKGTGNSNNIKVDVASVTKSVESQSKFLNYMRRVGKCYLATMKALPMPIFVTFSALILTHMCTKNNCSLLVYPDLPLNLTYYYDEKAIKITLGFLSAIVLMSYIPLGKIVKARNGANIRCNGFVSLLACFLIVPVLLKADYNLALIYVLYRQFLPTFTAIGLLISIALYFKSFYAKRDEINPSGNSGYFFPDFTEGREVNPRIGNLDIKVILFRFFILTSVMINIIIVITDLQAKGGEYSPTLLMACALQIFYAVDFIWFEDSFLTTYEYLKQGTGLIVCVGYMNMPFFTSLYSRYVYNHRTELPWYCLVGIAGCNLVGYIIVRGANSQKHSFRSNPNDPKLSHLESLPTSAGQRLLVSGWWGLVRHPNYLGEIVVQLSWALICGFNHGLPWLVLALSVLYLITRVIIVEKECKRKYGLAWSSYVSRVPHRIIPKVL